jgi:DNA-directed RNA polymerase specialized sigma subunit
MENFSMYYIKRSLEDSVDSVLSESAESFDFTSFVRKNRRKSELAKHVRRLSAKHPSVQNCDIEDAVLAALKEVSRKKPSSKSVATKIFNKSVSSTLSDLSKRSRKAKKGLSCLKSIKKSDSELSGLVAKAGKILTANERKVLDLCSEGRSVRKIGEEMGISFPTAWRILNSAIDKVRISHGMKSRKKG